MHLFTQCKRTRCTENWRRLVLIITIISKFFCICQSQGLTWQSEVEKRAESEPKVRGGEIVRRHEKGQNMFLKGYLWFGWFGLFTNSRRETSGKCSGGSNLPWKPLTESIQKVAAASLVFWTILFDTNQSTACWDTIFPDTILLWLLIINELPVESAYIYFYNSID